MPSATIANHVNKRKRNIKDKMQESYLAGYKKRAEMSGLVYDFASELHARSNFIKWYNTNNKKDNMEKEFKVERLKNGMGHSHLVVIVEDAIEDVHIGSLIIVPYAEGFKDPVKVLLQTDKKGMPLTANEKFGIVLKFIYK